MKCLVIEDDPHMAAMLCDSLVELGHNVDSVATCHAAMRAVRTKKFNFVVLDYNLPDGDSLQVAEYAAATQPNVRTLLLTGEAVFPNGEARIMAPAVDWILRKPASLADFEALVAYAERDSQEHCA